MTQKKCKCGAVAYRTDGEKLIVDDKEFVFSVIKKGKFSWECLNPECKEWIHWQKKA